MKIKLTDTDFKKKGENLKILENSRLAVLYLSMKLLFCVTDGLNKGKCNVSFLVKSRNVSFLVP